MTDPNEAWLTHATPASSTEIAVTEPATIEPVSQFPDGHEWQQLCTMAVTLAGSSLVPTAVRNKPADVLLILLTARSLGIDPTAGFRLIHVIEGKPTVAPKLRLALLNQTGRGRIVPRATSATSVTAAVFYGNQLVEERTLDITEVPADLLRKKNWKDYPARMLYWRLAGWLLDDHFPEVGLGVYSPDELGAVTDEDGNPITVETVGSALETPQAEAPQPERRMISPDLAEALQANLNRLKPPDDVESHWRDEWTELRAKVLAEWKSSVGTAPNGFAVPPAQLDYQQGQKAAALMRRVRPEIDDLWETWQDATGAGAVTDAIIEEDHEPDVAESGYYE